MDISGLTQGINPFNRHDWTGRILTVGDVSDEDFTEDDVAEIIAQGTTSGDWDGTVAAVFRLKDGRFVAYETSYGPTGDGFAADAYGGDADITIATNLFDALRMGLTAEGRQLCGYPRSVGDQVTLFVEKEK